MPKQFWNVNAVAESDQHNLESSFSAMFHCRDAISVARDQNDPFDRASFTKGRNI